MIRYAMAMLVVVLLATPALAQQGKPRVDYFELRADSLDAAEQALGDFMLGNPLRFSWNLSERIDLDYDFAFSAPTKDQLDGLDQVEVGIVMDVRRCGLPIRLDLPSPKVTRALPEADREAWRARTDALRGAQLLHYQVFRESGIVERACRQIENIAAMEIPLVKRKALRDLIRVHLHDRVALILEHYQALLGPYHKRLEKLREGGGLDGAAEAALFAELREKAAALPDFK
ncbi:MAG: hypothetical protein KDH09_05515 [Chrysiogenetes bacterium]|nr:hypothetical protein [Chrysiogenetes bacterium]